MRDIAKLLFGQDAAKLLDLFTSDGEDDRMAERVRRSGEWCGSTPGHDVPRGVRHPGPVHHQIIIREFFDR